MSEFLAWKDEDLRDDIDYPMSAHPSGQIDLSGITGGDDLGVLPRTTLHWVCTISVVLSCTCAHTVSNGTCGAFTVGCC